MSGERNQDREDETNRKKILAVILLVIVSVIAFCIVWLMIYPDPEPELPQNPRLGVKYEVNESEESVSINITIMGNSDYAVVWGEGLKTKLNITGKPDGFPVLNSTGELTLEANEELEKGSGRLVIVAVVGEIGELYPLWSSGYEEKLEVYGSHKSPSPDVRGKVESSTVAHIEYNFSS